VLAAEQEEGPYYIHRELIRKNVAEDRKGVPLKLQVRIVDSTSCAPLPRAAVDIWHCDATGLYSGFTANSVGGPPPGPPPDGRHFPPPDGFDHPHGPPPGFGRGPTDNKMFLRGVQLTDETGCAEFLTIYPGWYVGRSIHIHLKVHTGGHISHTGQLFFPEEITEQISVLDPYRQHHAPRTLQSEDHVFLDEHGQSSVVELARVHPDSLTHGLVATALLGVDPKAMPRDVGFVR
jgi:protocatechuate 3,4-dioxygenase beta subunit